jgi:hypothetical protein
MNKAQEVAKIRKDFHEWHAKFMPDLKFERSCFYQAVFTSQHLKTLNLGRVLIAAGSMSYPRIDMSKDDGIMATHYSYVFEPYSLDTIASIENNMMPEMHVWVTLPDQGEIVDITTCYLKELCENHAGIKWLAPDPPDFIWSRTLPEHVYYTPDPKAVLLIPYFFKLTWG